MSFFPKLLDHVAWADAQVSAAIAALDIDRVERSQATRIYSHVAAAEHVWHSRLENRPPAHVVWPDLSLEAAAALVRESLADTYARMVAAGVRFVTAPRREPYGDVAVFLDIEGNRWDLLGPDPG